MLSSEFLVYSRLHQGSLASLAHSLTFEDLISSFAIAIIIGSKISSVNKGSRMGLSSFQAITAVAVSLFPSRNFLNDFPRVAASASVKS